MSCEELPGTYHDGTLSVGYIDVARMADKSGSGIRASVSQTDDKDILARELLRSKRKD